MYPLQCAISNFENCKVAFAEWDNRNMCPELKVHHNFPEIVLLINAVIKSLFYIVFVPEKIPSITFL